MRLFTVFLHDEKDLITVNFSEDFIEFGNENKLETLEDSIAQLKLVYETVSQRVKAKNGDK